MQELEIVLSAENWDEAVQLLESIGIDEKTRTTHRPISGLFMVKAEKDTPFTEVEYEKIKANPNIAILGDSFSRQRITAVLDKIYDVETQLRKLLLHSYDLIDTFFEVFKESKYTKDFRSKKTIARRGSLDPITSHLTLGEMKDVLGVDLSWNKRKTVSALEIHELLQSVDSISSLKDKFATKVKIHTVWDVIAANVLKTKTEWNEVNNELKVLKEFRDMSAHYQVITESDKNKLVKKADHLLMLLNPPERKLTQIEEANLSDAAKSLNKLIRQIKSSTLTGEYYQNLIAKTIADFKIVRTPAQDAIANMSKQSAYLSELLSFYNAKTLESYNSSLSMGDEGKDEGVDPEDNELDDEDLDTDAALVRK